MPKPSKFKLLLLLVLLIAGTLVTFVPRSQALALTYPVPKWWNGDTCDSTHFNASGQTAHLLTTWNGIQVCGYGPTQGGTEVSVQFTQGGSTEYEWDCTELVKRYLFTVYGALSLGNTNGSQVVDNYTNTYSNLFTKVTNDGSTHIKVGDVLSYSGTDNHTAIVYDTSGLNSSGTGTIKYIEQNANIHGWYTQTVTNWVIKHGVDDGGSTDTVAAWLTPKQGWSDNSPSGTTNDLIYSMSASSTTNIWASGYEKPTSGDKQPVTYHNTGSGFTKVSPPSQGSSNEHQLYGIAASSSDAWTVGKLYSYPHYVTLAYRWNGSAWVLKTSDNPSSTQSNALNGVTIDSSGGIWAVGYYYDGSTDEPLIEEWNGTKLAQQTISAPSGCANTRLNSVTFSSSTNGWAVGYTNCSSTKYYVVYHYNGTSWSSTVGTITTSNLLSVAAISDGEAWAIGGQGTNSTPLILHYISGSWTEDTSFNSFYPTYATLYGVGADSSSNVWIVGWWYNSSTSKYVP